MTMDYDVDLIILEHTEVRCRLNRRRGAKENIAEIGRQPYTAHRFFLKYADRILFGIDATVNADEYRLYYRFLESDDEYMGYNHRNHPTQGRWQVYGLHLPPDVLAKVYFQNAARLIPGLSDT